MTKTIVVTVGVGLVVLFLNGLYTFTISPTHFSPLYCWGGYLAAPLWRLWAEYLFIASVCLFIFGLFTNWSLAATGVLLAIVISGAPEFARILTGGAACL